MQKKRYWIDKYEIIEINSCDECESHSIRSGFRVDWSECNITGNYEKDRDYKGGDFIPNCPLIEAETKEGAFQKMFDVFYESHNEDGYNRFIDTFKSLIIAMVGSLEEEFDADKKSNGNRL